uniref:hypothetical protein n=1 Tax=Frankia sp. Cj3 TaxID=2880976 RepID=UPI001EF4149C
VRIEYFDMSIEAGSENPVMAPQVCRVSVGELSQKLSISIQNKYSLTHFRTLRPRLRNRE